MKLKAQKFTLGAGSSEKPKKSTWQTLNVPQMDHLRRSDIEVGNNSLSILFRPLHLKRTSRVLLFMKDELM